MRIVWPGQIASHPQSSLHQEARHSLCLSFLPSSVLAQTGASGAHEEGGSGGKDGQSLPIVLFVQASMDINLLLHKSVATRNLQESLQGKGMVRVEAGRER